MRAPYTNTKQVLLIGLLLCTTAAVGQASTPAQSFDTHEPMLPAWIDVHDAELSAALAYIWSGDDAQQIIHFIGDFQFLLGARRMHANEAVVWMNIQQHDDRQYSAFEIFLWHEASIEYPGHVQTTGPALFATADTFGAVKLFTQDRAFTSNAQSSTYQDGLKVLAAYRAGELQEQPAAQGPGPLTALDLGAAPRRTEITEFTGTSEAQRVGDEIIAVAADGFFLSRGAAGDEGYIEVRADAAVLFLAATEQNADGDAQKVAGLSGSQPTGVYLEGDVLLTQGARVRLRAKRLYYDLEHDRALIIDPILRVQVSGRKVPFYVRAQQARQLSSAEFSARAARISTSEFYTPHYHIGAEKIYFATDAAQGPTDTAQGLPAGGYRMTGTTFNINNVPILYWPVSGGNFQQGDSSFRSARVGYDGDFGFTIESRWHLFPLLLNQGTPKGFDFAYLELDGFTERGVGVGADTEYEFDDSFGLFRGYYIYDLGDRDDFTQKREPDIEHPNRGRATLRHRQYFGEGWDLTVEASYLSDDNFLEAYFEKEFDDGKPQETYAQLRRQLDNWAYTFTYKVRLNNWLEQTERLPESTFRLTGRNVGPLTVFSNYRLGSVRYRPDDRRIFTSEKNAADNRVASTATARGDTRQEVEWPFALGPLKVVPFATGQATYWDDAPHAAALCRAFGVVGLRSSMFLYKIFEDVESELLDISGLRHIIKLDVVSWLAGTNVDSSQLYPFDQSVEGIDGTSGTTFGIRQRWQTHRGSGDLKRAVDWLTLDLEAGFFSNAQGDEFTDGYASYTRPEDSYTSNYVSGKFQWRVGDTTMLLGDASYNTDDGDIDIVDLSLAFERTPRFSYFTGWRLIGETDSNLYGFGFNYRMTEKHTLGFRSYFDLDRGETEQVDVTYIRKFPRWYAAFTFELDEIKDNISASVSIWPEGYPNAALGAKRYTGLATSTAIESD